ncbi:uncharacterized protein LOC108904393 [Anoplophora glabripennis]|uniref:uncharacterized protein LOC108904393 n=1 Tax=Anoplophora glabripennis TaxID=217634 RepID=UPI0008754162|nr:uncharacterized protein LOC108904393 [Anoplophora glabripennis]XP_018562438.1 uncharacterized protein LOC108904393 [Anoplophora glabripennis]
METQFLDMDMDPTKLVYTSSSPYGLNPDMETSVVPATLNVDVMLKDESSVTLQRLWDMSRGGVFYEPQSKIKLEMEEFSDLSPFVHPKPSSTNSVDELNTPIFDKDAFTFNVNDYSDDIFVKPESDILYENSCIITDNNQFKDLYLNTGKVQQNGNINSDVGNILQNADINVFSPQSETGSAYSCQISPILENTNTTVYNVDDNSALSVNRLSRISSANDMFRPFNSGLETPEDSNSSASHDSIKRPSHLSLNVNLKSTTESNLTTPSIIEEVVDLENANFNILDLVTNEDITFVNAEDIFTNNSVVSAISTNVNTSTIKHKHIKQIIPQKRPRKRRIYTDDDEDYVPPSKKNIVQRKKIIKEDSDSELDSDVDVAYKTKAKTRGRPPKRTESVSSDCSKDSDASKYRELRDKNNEASRKSRLKRKIKELELEKEAEGLICKNIKLKAQVEELEKMVTNFRDNLFKIMIKK